MKRIYESCVNYSSAIHLNLIYNVKSMVYNLKIIWNYWILNAIIHDFMVILVKLIAIIEIICN
jgi:hypothetical protein